MFPVLEQGNDQEDLKKDGHERERIDQDGRDVGHMVGFGVTRRGRADSAEDGRPLW